MTVDGVLRYLHLVAAMVWVGGLLTLGALVPALRSAGADRPLLQAAARRFGVVSWTAMVVAVVTGALQIERIGYDWLAEPVVRKVGLVLVAIVLALVHQFTAHRTSPAVRGMIQAVILVVSLAIVAAAVAL